MCIISHNLYIHAQEAETNQDLKKKINVINLNFARYNNSYRVGFF